MNSERRIPNILRRKTVRKASVNNQPTTLPRLTKSDVTIDSNPTPAKDNIVNEQTSNPIIKTDNILRSKTLDIPGSSQLVSVSTNEDEARQVIKRKRTLKTVCSCLASNTLKTSKKNTKTTSFTNQNGEIKILKNPTKKSMFQTNKNVTEFLNSTNNHQVDLNPMRQQLTVPKITSQNKTNIPESSNGEGEIKKNNNKDDLKVKSQISLDDFLVDPYTGYTTKRGEQTGNQKINLRLQNVDDNNMSMNIKFRTFSSVTILKPVHNESNQNVEKSQTAEYYTTMKNVANMLLKNPNMFKCHYMTSFNTSKGNTIGSPCNYCTPVLSTGTDVKLPIISYTYINGRDSFRNDRGLPGHNQPGWRLPGAY